MKLYKKKWFWAIVVIVVLIIICGVYGSVASKNANKVQYTTEEVNRGEISQSVSATGAVQSAHEIDMNFKNIGKITSVTIKEGDSVKSGQILAKIDDASAQTAVKQARASLTSAQANLAKVKAGASSEDVRLTQEQLNKSLSDLASLNSDSQLQLKNLRDKNIDALASSAINMQVALDKTNNHFFNKDTTSNLYFTDSNLYNSVNSQYGILAAQLATVKSAIETAKSQRTDSAIASASGAAKSLMADINSFLDKSYDLAGAVIVNSYYTQSVKDGIKSDINSQSAAVSTAQSALQLADSTLTNSSSSFASQIKSAQNNINIAQAQLALKKAGARNFDVQSAQAAVAQAQAVLEGAMNNLKDYQIMAPIDGKIIAVNYSVGEQPNGSVPAIKMLSNEKFEIKVDIPESDIAKIKTGNKAVIDLDAFGSDHQFDGAVTFIDPAQTVAQDVIYYKTTITFADNDLESQIKPGMTANVTIATAKKQDVLYIPQRAVKVREAALDQKADKYVEVLTVPEKVQERVVATGLKADGGLVEILSGLSEGDKVVTFKKLPGTK